jgi:hypothetical protein
MPSFTMELVRICSYLSNVFFSLHLEKQIDNFDLLDNLKGLRNKFKISILIYLFN